MEWNTGSYEYSPGHRLPGSNTPAGSNAARGSNLKFPRQLPICSQELSLPTPYSPQNLDRKSVAARQRRPETHAARFDFRRPDCIPKSQVRAIQVLHDTFVTSLASSLSAFLRTYLTVKLVSVDQLSYGEFLDGLPSPTCLVSLGLSPYDGSAVMELNPSLTFPIIEMLLGGSGKTRAIQRDITEIEQKVLDGLFRIVLQDLREAWKPVTPIEFAVESMESEP
jgi:flagellar motor switch protein FliM